MTDWQPIATAPCDKHWLDLNHLVEAIESGLDDIKHGRVVEGEAVLAGIRKKLALWREQQKRKMG